MIDFRHTTGRTLMWLSLFVIVLAIPLLASPAFSAPPYKSTLLSCPNAVNNVCGTFYVLTLAPEPLIDGSVVVSATGVLKVKVNGAFPNTTYEVVMISSAGGQFDLVGFLSTDVNGDGDVGIPLPADTYASGVILMRDTDGSGPAPTPPGCIFPNCSPTGSGTDPRIFSGFVIP